MANVEEAKTDYLKVKKSLASCHTSIAELQRKCDTLQESLPGLGLEIENSVKAKTAALDAFALNSNKTTEQALKGARQAHEDAQKKLSETNELIEAAHRALKKQEAELIKLNNAVDLARRECWQVFFDEVREGIPKNIFGDIKSLFVAGVQCCKSRQFILDNLFPNIPTEEFQKIRNELCVKFGLD